MYCMCDIPFKVNQCFQCANMRLRTNLVMAFRNDERVIGVQCDSTSSPRDGL